MTTVRKAVIPAAGLGTRFLPATKSVPKEMFPLVDKPVIQYVVEEAVSAGIEEIVIITRRGKQIIEDYFNLANSLEPQNLGGNHLKIMGASSLQDVVDIRFVRQEQPLGLGHAVLQARRCIAEEPFAILLPDEVITGTPACLEQMIRKHQQLNCSIVAVQPVAAEAVSRYGIVRGEFASDGNYRIHGMVEKPTREEAPTNIAMIGRYILDPVVFDILERATSGRSGEVELTDALNALAISNPVYALQSTAKRFDVGSAIGYVLATIEIARARPDIRAELDIHIGHS